MIRQGFDFDSSESSDDIPKKPITNKLSHNSSAVDFTRNSFKSMNFNNSSDGETRPKRKSKTNSSEVLSSSEQNRNRYDSYSDEEDDQYIRISKNASRNSKNIGRSKPAINNSYRRQNQDNEISRRKRKIEQTFDFDSDEYENDNNGANIRSSNSGKSNQKAKNKHRATNEKYNHYHKSDSSDDEYDDNSVKHLKVKKRNEIYTQDMQKKRSSSIDRELVQKFKTVGNEFISTANNTNNKNKTPIVYDDDYDDENDDVDGDRNEDRKHFKDSYDDDEDTTDYQNQQRNKNIKDVHRNERNMNYSKSRKLEKRDNNKNFVIERSDKSSSGKVKETKRKRSVKSESSQSSNDENFDIEKQMSIHSNPQQDWSFPMKYVPEPQDMDQIIEDYHAKYSIDYLLRKIMSNQSQRVTNDE
ncbi:hypothetical protein TRFO_20142 [Tritrichomonas foetus]|uniref:Uncharacterized protein n=1 Tax=Tritrichomonas foetus TaxID=1144522 RepID=A0A1J4KMF4_9EUKA|nr:hypothetical protein TRFO_20142 [Tritrichomonas foetus]|eukprot:OHT10549.1 hypothetical protein TRFO_20142 [Tritrichomonas foetus]